MRQPDVAPHVLYSPVFLLVYVLGGHKPGIRKICGFWGLEFTHGSPMDRRENAPRRHLWGFPIALLLSILRQSTCASLPVHRNKLLNSHGPISG